MAAAVAQRHVRAGLLALSMIAAAVATAGSMDVAVDAMVSVDLWQVGGRRINYVLGRSAVRSSEEHVRPGAAACLELHYDFQEPRRDYVSAFYRGPATPGYCRELTFWLFGDGSGRRLRVSIEDATGRWFQRYLGAIDWEDWRQVTVPVAEGQGWRGLVRIGETRGPMQHPICMRQVSVMRRPEAALLGSVWLHDLRARVDAGPADWVTAQMTTGRVGNLFDVGEPVAVQAALANRGTDGVAGTLSATVTDFFGRATPIPLGEIDLARDAALTRTVRYATDRTGTYELELRLESAGRTRHWLHRFAVTRAYPPRAADVDALFGCMFNLRGYSPEHMPVALRLNRDAGIRWARISFTWRYMNPSPGVWAWDGAARVSGPVGQAAALKGQSVRRAHEPAMDCVDEVTVGFWARASGANNTWQTPLNKWGGGNRRNYGVYFSLREGVFCFSASFEKHPGRKHCDFPSGFSGWDGRWHHYAATYSRLDRRVVLYVDGQARAEHDFDGGRLRTNTADLVLGSGYPGELDEVVLHRRALSPDEVARLARKEPTPRDGLLGHWAFEGKGARLADSSGNGLALGQQDCPGAARARFALEHDIRTLGLIGFPPRWASSAPEDAERFWVHKPDLRAWSTFVHRVAARHRDLCGHWEIWNEPNISVFWEPKPDPDALTDVVKAGYVAAKRGDPECTVITPGLAGPGHRKEAAFAYLDRLFELGGADYCDAVSIHPYRQSTPEASDLEGDLRRIVDKAEQCSARRRLWYTENCWTTQIGGGSSERRQALMLPRGYVLSLGTGLVERLIWFRLHDPGIDRFYTEHNYGMCHHDLTPKPAYFAHMTVARLLEKARPDGTWAVGPNALARCFRTPSERVAAVWCPEGRQAVAVFVGEPTARVVDIMCNEREEPTEAGVLLLQASEAVEFLRGLPDAAEPRSAPICSAAVELVRGGAARVALRVSNPFDVARVARVTVSGRRPVAVSRGTLDLTLAPRESVDAGVTVTAAPNAEPGVYALQSFLRLGQRDLEQRLCVRVRGASATAGPVGHWRLDEGQGQRLVDSSGHGNHGTLRGGTWAEGKRGRGLMFDGKGEAVVPNAASLNVRDEVTLAFWFRWLGDTGTWQFPVAKFEGDLGRNYGIYLRPGQGQPAFSASLERAGFRHTDVGASVGVADGHWHHLAATYSMFSGRVRVFVDGRLEVERGFRYGAMRLTGEPIRFGLRTHGIIDEVVVYPRALSPAEVAGIAK